jgi:hypothetical protein
MRNSGLDFARQLNGASESEWPILFEQVRGERRLSAAIREINELLQHDQYRQEAVAALRRTGLFQVDGRS